MKELSKVILVDENDREIGHMEKKEAHEKGLLHRAVFVFIFNSKLELLLQQRGENEYNSGGLWTNTACTHPYKNESIEDAAKRCVLEEMGITEVPLHEIFEFVYQEEVGNNLIEHEFGHVFIGFSDIPPKHNVQKVMAFAYQKLSQIFRDIHSFPFLYTKWFEEMIRYHITDLHRGIFEKRDSIL